MTIFADWAQQTWYMLVEAAPWLLGGFLLAGVVHVLVPVSAVTRHLGKPGASAIVKAALLGIPLPLCSCSVIPVASSIRRQGASRGAFASFLISTPETGVDSIAISYAMLGPFLTIVRPVAAFVTAVTAGLLVGRSDGTSVARDIGDAGAPTGTDSCGSSQGCAAESSPADGASTTRRSLSGKMAAAVRYGLVDMITDLSPWLVLGFLLAGLAAAFIPQGFLESHVGAGLPAMLLMLVVGLPMYVCSTSSTPIAAALIARGLSPGAALVFLLAGPATNRATMVVVSRVLGRRGLVVYLISIAAVAILFGLLVDALLPSLPVSLAGLPDCSNEPVSSTAWAMTLLVLLLTLNGLRARISSGWAANRKDKDQ